MAVSWSISSNGLEPGTPHENSSHDENEMFDWIGLGHRSCQSGIESTGVNNPPMRRRREKPRQGLQRG